MASKKTVEEYATHATLEIVALPREQNRALFKVSKPEAIPFYVGSNVKRESL